MTVPVASGIAKEVTLSRRFGDDVLTWSNGGLAMTATTTLSPTAGTSLRILWVSVQPNSDNSVSNLIQVGFVGVAQPLYTAYVIGHWQKCDAPADDVGLRFTLANSQPVAVTVHYSEV